MMIKYFLIFYILLCVILLPGCGKQVQQDEIKQYISDLRIAANKKEVEKSAASLQLPTPVRYKDDSSGSANREGVVKSGNPVESYPVKSLQFVGTLVQNNKMAAYIMAPDNMIYLVKVGDTIGDNYGKIIKIDSDHIEISEKYVKSGNEKAERIVTMKLKD